MMASYHGGGKFGFQRHKAGHVDIEALNDCTKKEKEGIENVFHRTSSRNTTRGIEKDLGFPLIAWWELMSPDADSMSSISSA